MFGSFRLHGWSCVWGRQGRFVLGIIICIDGCNVRGEVMFLGECVQMAGKKGMVIMLSAWELVVKGGLE